MSNQTLAAAALLLIAPRLILMPRILVLLLTRLVLSAVLWVARLRIALVLAAALWIVLVLRLLILVGHVVSPVSPGDNGRKM